MNFPEKKPILANLEGYNFLKFSWPVSPNNGGASLNTKHVPPSPSPPTQSKLCVAVHAILIYINDIDDLDELFKCTNKVFDIITVGETRINLSYY